MIFYSLWLKPSAREESIFSAWLQIDFIVANLVTVSMRELIGFVIENSSFGAMRMMMFAAFDYSF